MRFFATGRAVLVSGLLAALPFWAQACAKNQPPEQAPSVAANEQPSTAKAPPPTARPMAPDPRVGAVFLGGGDLHTCTGGVLDSAAGDLILTAAHCVAQGVDATFVAGLHDTAAPEDVWHIDAVYLDPRWVQNQDPMADFAIARVSRDAGGSVKDLAGGGLKLGQTPKPGTVITVTGYAMGVGGGPIGCQTPTAQPTKGFPAFDCAQLIDGLSGAPWIEGSTVAGVIGGLNGGGCADESISYSPPFDDAIKRLLARAEAGGPGDVAPTVLDDDCG
ncbi:Trypsin [Mycobacterium sp. JS623]|uniref:trypsin-like serine peptidase n=1 Tax=Mycobacterium sp. JS623 TaxID=212767 RepID=UPI0002A57C31|nr:trypsin-like serine protease [Mycobacterium sp. JS623]AGB22917.1 Trypsin [Mycobacterium sp. JS623]